MTKPRVLVLAEQCNPEWPSLPIVGYKYAKALSAYADITIVTQVRNKENVLKAGHLLDRFEFLDTEHIAAPMNKFANFLRGGTEVAWSTNMIMSYLPYIAFERAAWKRYRSALQSGAFDVVHRVTPMSPTMPSYIAHKVAQPFVIGPLNGNLDWPAAYKEEQKRERELLRRLRDLYKFLPYARSTFRNSAAILAAFKHTIDDIDARRRDQIVPFPEVGYDTEVFHTTGRKPVLSGEGPVDFLFAGRLVPYKVPEAAVRAFVTSDTLKPHKLHIIGDGPEAPRLKAIVAEEQAEDRVIFHGRKPQSDVAAAMRDMDVFVFPSVRELGAGVVVEAMASGMVNIVTNYGAPGDLIGVDRGYAVPLAPIDALTQSLRDKMERCISHPQEAAGRAAAAEAFAREHYTWDKKAFYTAKVYDAVMNGAALDQIDIYA